MNSINDMRYITSKGILCLVLLNTVIVSARAFFSSEINPQFVIIASLALAALFVLTWIKDKTGPITRTTSGFVLAAQVALLVYGFTGSSLQLDMHMYFFATLAICGGWVDWRPIMSFTGLTAVHHLALYYIIPSAVFTGDATLIRVAIHAVILVVEAGALLAILHLIDKAFSSAEQAIKQAEAASSEAEQLSKATNEAKSQAEKLHQERDQERQAQSEAMGQTIKQLADGLDRLAHGDFTRKITVPFGGDLDRLRDDYNETVDKLSSTLKMISENVESIHSSTSHLNGAIMSLSKRTEDQANSVQEAAESMREISKIVEANSERVEDTNEITELTKADSIDSSKVAEEAVNAVGRIEEASSQINTIISVIDEIALQTNLLALNAGVEAARAGEAGSGFAVVAQEVRELAGRSAKAAKEIKELINQSSVEVRTGANLVNKTGEVIGRITERMTQTSENIQAIASSSKEQTMSIDNLGSHIHGIDDGTQQNAALAEETSAAMHELTRDTKGLMELISKFQIEVSKTEMAA